MKSWRLATAVTVFVSALAGGLNSAAPARAASGCDNWTGAAGDSQWHTAGNWSMNMEPSSTVGACIGSDSGVVKTGNGYAAAAYITIAAGVTIDVNASGAGNPAVLYARDAQSDAQGNPAHTDQGIVNNGIIKLETTGSSLAVIDVLAPAQLHNAGSVVSTIPDPGGYAQIRGDVTNSGTIESTGGTLAFALSGTVHNNARVIADPGAVISANGGTFVNDTGTITSSASPGGFRVDGVTFVGAAGTITGQVHASTGAVFDLSGSGTGTFVMDQDAQVHLSADVSAGYSLSMPEGGELNVSSALISRGAISLTSVAGHFGYLTGQTLTNAGTLRVSSDGGTTQGLNLQADVVNRATMEVTNGNADTYDAFTQQAGTLTVDAATSFNPQNFFVSGGSIADIGSITVGYGLSVSGGDVTGNPPICRYGVTLTGAGTGTYNATNGASLTSDLAAGYQLIADGDLSLGGGARTINGTLELRGGTGTNPNAYSATSLTNRGTIEVTPSGAQYRVINADAFDNEGILDVGADLTVTPAMTTAGRVAVHGGVTMSDSAGVTQSAGQLTLTGDTDTLDGPLTLTGGTLAGGGLVTGNLTNAAAVTPAGRLHVGGSYTQRDAGLLETAVRGRDAVDTLQVTGAATLAGSLQVMTAAGFSPPAGSTYVALSAAAVTGTFSTVGGLDSGPYTLGYSATAATLVAAGRPVTPPGSMPGPAAPTPSVSVGDVSIDNASIAGSAAATFTLSLSAPSADPVSAPYRTANGTAIAPDDYSSTSGTATIPAGQTSVTVTVQVFPSSRPAATRTFFLDLGTPSGADLGTLRGTATLHGALILTSSSPTVIGAGTATLTVTGGGFSTGDLVTVSASGQSPVSAVGVASVDGKNLIAVLDAARAAAGPRDVTVVSRGGLGTRTLGGALSVVSATPPKIEASIVGPSSTRPGVGWYGHVFLRNAGNVDAVDTVLRIDGLPGGGTQIRVDGTAGDAQLGGDDEESYAIAVAPRVPAGGFTDLGLEFITLSKNAHLAVASIGVTVVDNSDPSLTEGPRPNITPTVTVGLNGQFNASLHVANGSFSDTLSVEVHRGPPPRNAANGPVVTYAKVRGKDVWTVAAPELHQGCTVAGDTSADVLNWNCDNTANVLRSTGTNLNSGISRGHVVTSAASTSYWVYTTVTGTYGKGKNAFDNFVTSKEARALRNARRRQSNCLVRAGLLTRDQQAELDQLAAGELFAVSTKGLRDKVLDSINPSLATIFGAEFDTLTNATINAWDKQLSTIRYQKEVNLGTATDANIVAALTHWRYTQAIVDGICPPDGKRRARFPVGVFFSGDPNDITGPGGPGSRHYQDGKLKTYVYDVAFQNVPTASAAAYRVSVTDQLDRSRLDPTSVALGPVAVGNHLLAPPAGSQHFVLTLDLRPDKQELLEITGDVDTGSGLITWTFASIDPVTHRPVTSADGGFLPPDLIAPQGEGGVSFSVNPTSAALRDRAVTADQASIVFDTNEPIRTPVWTSVTDRSRPSTRITRAKRGTVKIGTGRRAKVGHVIALGLRGSDKGSGVAGFDVYAGAVRGRPLAATLRGRNLAVPCKPGRTYRLLVVARDRVGNRQARGTRAKAITC